MHPSSLQQNAGYLRTSDAVSKTVLVAKCLLAKKCHVMSCVRLQPSAQLSINILLVLKKAHGVTQALECVDSLHVFCITSKRLNNFLQPETNIIVAIYS